MQELDIKKILNEPARLNWACRRGMLELDVILGKFLKNAYPNLAESDKILFIKLLDCSDPELFAWLLGHEIPEDPDALHIITMIRDHVKSRI